MKTFNVNGVVDRLNSMMGSRFGVTVKYIPVSDQSADGSRAVDTVRRNASAPLIITGKHMLIPVRVNGSLLGATVVNNITSLDPKSLNQIKESIDLVMVEGFSAQEELERKDAELNQLELTTKPSNVLNFAEFVVRNKRIKALFAAAKDLSDENIPVTLEGEEGTDFESIAKELGDEDSPFVKSDDHKQALLNVDALQSLGSVTLFIERLEKLNGTELESLSTYLNMKKTEIHGPRIVVALRGSEEIPQGLKFRLQTFSIRIPPLRERPEDLILLLQNAKHKLNFTPDALARLLDYSWPGNERELQSEIQRLSQSKAKSIGIETLQSLIVGQSAKKLLRLLREKDSLASAIEQMERKLIADGLKKHKGNKSKVSRELGISRSNLLIKIQQLKIATS